LSSLQWQIPPTNLILDDSTQDKYSNSNSGSELEEVSSASDGMLYSVGLEESETNDEALKDLWAWKDGLTQLNEDIMAMAF
jgi:hypothetical protein